MESPFSWGKAEHVVAEAISDAERAREEGRMGFSTPMRITNALREAGLLGPLEPLEFQETTGPKEVSESA